MKTDWSALRSGTAELGVFLSTGYPVNAEVVGQAGFDFVVIDLEHGMGSEREVLAQVYALASTPTAAVVRVESHVRQRVHRVLDLGVDGIMFPRVETAEEARACVAAMHYPPVGERGVATMVRASSYGGRFVDYRDHDTPKLLTILQIESAAGVENADAIAAVPGADVLFVGPMDLSTSLGVFRQYDHPLFTAAVRQVVAAAEKHNRVLGILLSSPADLAKYHALGFRCFTCGTDIMFLRDAAQATMRGLRDALGSS
ncbi:MAG: 2-dehydro-3-deoxyglucarate aldolase [Acidobacteria bacterium]|nr:2-dehydro-3-deoxyglucarate aldolase [Acidobacteriota bacterium]